MMIPVCLLITVCQAWSAVILHNTGNPDDPSIIKEIEIMKQAHEAEDNNDYTLAIDLWKQAIAINPKLYVNYQEEEMDLHAMAGLAHAYYHIEDWENALSAFVTAQQYIEEFDATQESILPSYIAKCREKLAKEGKLESDPLAIVSNRLMKKSSISANGSMLASIEEAASLLNLDVKTDSKTKSVVLTAKDDSSKAMKMTARSKSAKARSESLLLSASPMMKGSEMYIPLRSVAEYFGHRVKWDSASKVAWIF